MDEPVDQLEQLLKDVEQASSALEIHAVLFVHLAFEKPAHLLDKQYQDVNICKAKKK